MQTFDHQGEKRVNSIPYRSISQAMFSAWRRSC